ncbi:MAG: dihydroorotate dehydrogenase electron transfer subunit [Caldilineaceae bacterium SB0670_bin_27]|uniref:Dihydroorotate dehydrogenase electron transfer subunit n=1 Tax=Caldilineaceae bacterium SB0664_bin_27 TaxID=2605260 RepID=A0A6B0YSD4_9CHLR|nr:dihydroorotate dehydrogenase electron transfer subunit [Caldilineaceae bacterium SB0664_bin_27]MYJ77457.1 dihydroorotate dehydrogenase electron transfer subunit [Caldilineaceae bacterium SB0670_bin_27]
MSNFFDRSAQSGALSLPAPFEILSVETDNYRTKTFTLDLNLNALPGQFVMAWLPRFDEKPFSLVASDPVTLMVTAVGPFTNLLHGMGPGDLIWIRGPFGTSFRLPGPGLRATFVGGGYGVAPLLWLARAWRRQLEELTVIIGAGEGADLLYVDRFNALRREAKSNATRIEVLTCTEDGSAGSRGLVTDLLSNSLNCGETDLLCACGPHGMLTAIDSLGEERNIARQLSWEAYMRCAIGICGSCELNGSVLCLDGPVLEHG